VGRASEITDDRHAIERRKLEGLERDVRLDIAQRERLHDLTVIRIRADIREDERSVEELDRKQVLTLERLEELQRLEIAAKAHESQVRTMRDLQAVELDGEARRVDLSIKGGDAEHRRQRDAHQLAAHPD